MEKSFPCVKCGLCCRMIRSISSLASLDNGNGVCRYLAHNLCIIYENRPQICNVEKVYDTYFKSDMTEDQFIKINLDSCKKIAMVFNDENALQKIKEITQRQET